MSPATWKVRIAVRVSRFSGCSSSARRSWGSLAKASSVGAKTVNGPGSFRASVRPAASTAATSVSKRPSAVAVSRIVPLPAALGSGAAGAAGV